ncbi:type II toxin-antitoxin system RelE/ParE family toxin [Candidatus Wolfebacteria bacterium]|nr:type II toxin-antitoxin system RelE/ParE family toxin [Candidatus Wolfebacteria bacterium]
MRLTYSKVFLKRLSKLPVSVQEKTDGLLLLLSVDIRHPLLHTKRLRTMDDLYSFRIGRDYRCIFRILDTETVHLVDIAHPKDIYRG